MAGTFGASLIDQLRKAAKDELKTDKEVDALTFEKVLSDEGIPIPFANSAGFAAQTKEDIEAQKRTIDQIEDPAALANMVPDSIVGQLLNPDSVIRSDTGKFFANYARSRGFGVSDDASELGGDFKQALGERAAQHAQTLGFKEAERKQQQGFDVENVGADTLAGLPVQEQRSIQERFPSRIAEQLISPKSFSPGNDTLGPPSLEPDLEATRITPAMASSIMAERATADATAVAETLSVDQMNSYLDVLTQSINAPPGSFGYVDEDTPLPVARQLLSSVGTLVNSTGTQNAINDRHAKTLKARKDAAVQHVKDLKEVADHTIPLRAAHAMIVDNVATQNDLIVRGADAANKATLNKQQANLSLSNQLEVLTARAGIDANAAEINVANQHIRDIANDERKVNSDTYNHLLNMRQQLALVQAKGQGSSRSGRADLFEKTVQDLIKANPKLGGPILKILSELPPGELDSDTAVTTRTAISDVVNKMERENNAYTRVQEILLGGDKLQKENFSTPESKISAMRAERLAIIQGKSQSDMGVLIEEIDKLEELSVEKRRDLTAKQQETNVGRAEQLLEIDRIIELFDPSLTGTFNQFLGNSRLAGEKLAEMIPFFGDTLADTIGLTDRQKEFMARAGNLELTILQTGAGKAMTEMEIQILKRTRPVLGNPNYLPALHVYKEQIVDQQDLAAIEAAGGSLEDQQVIIDRMVDRAQKFLDRTGGVGTTGPESDKSSVGPYTSAEGMEQDYNQLKKNFVKQGMTPEKAHSAAMKLVNIRGLKEGG